MRRIKHKISNLPTLTARQREQQTTDLSGTTIESFTETKNRVYDNWNMYV